MSFPFQRRGPIGLRTKAYYSIDRTDAFHAGVGGWGFGTVQRRGGFMPALWSKRCTAHQFHKNPSSEAKKRKLGKAKARHQLFTRSANGNPRKHSCCRVWVAAIHLTMSNPDFPRLLIDLVSPRAARTPTPMPGPQQPKSGACSCLYSSWSQMQLLRVCGLLSVGTGSMCGVCT